MYNLLAKGARPIHEWYVAYVWVIAMAWVRMSYGINSMGIGGEDGEIPPGKEECNFTILTAIIPAAVHSQTALPLVSLPSSISYLIWANEFLSAFTVQSTFINRGNFTSEGDGYSRGPSRTFVSLLNTTLHVCC